MQLVINNMTMLTQTGLSSTYIILLFWRILSL